MRDDSSNREASCYLSRNIVFALPLFLAAVLFVSGAWQAQAGAGALDAQKQGYSVAVSGDFAVAGAQWHDGFKGAAYIFRRDDNGWVEEQKLSPADLGQYDHFGSSVSLYGNYAVVGATWQDSFRGAVYVFERVGNKWIERQKLQAGDAVPDLRFGTTVRIEGEEITVGCASLDSREAGGGLGLRVPD